MQETQSATEEYTQVLLEQLSFVQTSLSSHSEDKVQVLQPDIAG